MLTAAYRVTIERHVVGQIPALVFQCDSEGQPDCPFVFVVHGLTSRKERLLDLCLQLANAGFRVCAFDVRSHGERWDAEGAILFGDRSAPGFAAAFISTVIGTVQDVTSLADYFGLSAYGLVGHSMGGFIALHTALVDSRADAVVNIAGSIDTTRYSLPPDMPPEYLALAAMADVAGRATELAPRPVLLLHGEDDETVPYAGALRLFEALKTAYDRNVDCVTLVSYPGLGHQGLPAIMVEEAVNWLAKTLQKGKE